MVPSILHEVGYEVPFRGSRARGVGAQPESTGPFLFGSPRTGDKLRFVSFPTLVCAVFPGNQVTERHRYSSALRRAAG